MVAGTSGAPVSQESRAAPSRSRSSIQPERERLPFREDADQVALLDESPGLLVGVTPPAGPNVDRKGAEEAHEGTQEEEAGRARPRP